MFYSKPKSILWLFYALIGGLLLLVTTTRSTAALVAPTVATTPATFGPFNASNLPSSHDVADGNVVIPFDLNHLAQYSGFNLHRVGLNFAFQTEGASYAYELHLSLTSPDGTVFTAPHQIDSTAGSSSNSMYNVELPDFYGETAAGTWTVTVYDDFDDAGDDFTIKALSLTLLGQEVVVANDGLLGWWPMDGSNPGVLLQDHSGHNNDAYPTGDPVATDYSPLYYSDKIGSYDFDGTDYFRVPNNYGQLDSDTMSIAAWVRYEGDGSGNEGALFSMRDSAIRFTLSRATNGSLGSYNGSTAVSTAAGFLPASTWVHIAVVFDATETRVYKNGALHTTWVGYTPDTAAGQQGFYIGRNHNPKLDGKLADVRLFSRALSSDEIAGLGIVGWSIETTDFTPGFSYSSDQSAVVLTRFNRLLSIGGTHNGSPSTSVVELNYGSTDFYDKADMSQARSNGHTATRLNDGRVLAAGGDMFTGLPTAALNLEIYDEEADSWTLGPTFAAKGHTATLLADGRVLLVGGFLNEDEAFIFDPADDSLTATGDLNTPRSGHTATLLPDGSVLVVGGIDNLNGSVVVTSAEIWSPSTGQWTTVTDPSVARYSHTANLIMVNGAAKVALIGGRGTGGFTSITRNVELFDVATNTFTEVISNDSRLQRANHKTMLLADGTLLIIGGSTNNAGGITSTVLRYVPNANALQDAPALTYARRHHTATVLTDGRVAVFGGRDILSGSGRIEILFDAALEKFSDTWFGYFLDQSNLTNFRDDHLQDNCAALATNCDVRPAAMPIADDFTEYEGGEFYWQFCADYGDPIFDAANPTDNEAGLAELGGCPDWNADLSTAQRNVRFGGTFDSYTYNNTSSVRNAWIAQRDQQAGSALHFGSNWQSIAQEYTNRTIREIGSTHMLFGNEFMVKATRLPDNLNTFSDDQLLTRKLEYLQRALHQYLLASQTILDTAHIRVGGLDDVYMSAWLDADTLRLLTYASEQQVSALEEIVRGELIRGVETDQALLDDIAAAIATQNAQILLLADLFGELVPDDAGSSDDETAGAFVDVGGDMLINNIGRLSQLSELVRAGFNPLGYDSEFVPLKSTVDLLAFVCGAGNTSCTGALPGGLVGDVLTAQTAYIASTEQYTQNQADLGDALFDINQEAEVELTALCGGSGTNGANWDTCDAGLMEQNRLDFITANKAAAIAWERAQQISELIKIEENLAEITIEAIDNTSRTLFAYELAIGKLEAYRTTSTDFSSTSETSTQSVEASVTASVKASVNAGFPPGGGVEASLEVSASASTGMNWESSSGTNTETTVDINAQQIGKFNAMGQLREAEKEALIVGAQSSAEVKRLLLDQSTLLLEFELAQVDINKVIGEHNHLVDQYRLLKDQLAASEADVYDSYANDPYFRILKDRKAQIFEEKLRVAIHYAYLTAKSFEYTTLVPLDGSNGININDLYKVQSADGLQDFMTDIANAHFGLNLGFNKHRYKISFARHILGLTDEVIQNDTSATLTAAEISAERAVRFKQYVTDHTVDGKVILDFTTLLDLPAATNYFNVNLANLRVTGADNQSLGCVVNYTCYGLWLNFVTDQAATDFDANGRPDIRLSHGGHATYMRADRTFASYRPGPTRIIDTPSSFGNEDRISDFKANINMSADVAAQNPTYLTNDFQDLSVATSRWRFELDLSVSANIALQLSQLNDFEIRMDAVGFSANPTRDGQFEQAEAIRLTAVQNGAPIPQAALETVEQWLAEQKAVTPSHNSAGRGIVATPSYTLTEQSYGGRMFTLAPLSLNSTAVGFELFFNSNNTITGTLCAYCSAGYDNDVAVTGTWDSTPLTPTFSIETALFSDVNGVLHTLALSGEMQTRSRDLTVPAAPFIYAPFSGDPADGVQFLLGTFSEQIMGVAADVITRGGDFILTPPTADYVPATLVPTAVGLRGAATESLAMPLVWVLCGLVGLSWWLKPPVSSKKRA